MQHDSTWSAPLTTSLFFCQPGRGDWSGNGFLKQLEGVKGSYDSSLGPIGGRRALSIPERLQIVWYWITLIHSLPFSQRRLHYSLTFVVREPTFFFFALQALEEIVTTGCKVPSYYISCTCPAHILACLAMPCLPVNDRSAVLKFNFSLHLTSECNQMLVSCCHTTWGPQGKQGPVATSIT